MLVKTMYVRFYKSFNYDYLRKYKVNREDGEPWDAAPGSDLFYPFVRVEMDRGITTVVGANEAGKSQLIGALKRLLTGEGILANDFCRYSEFLKVDGQMLLPEFGAEFTALAQPSYWMRQLILRTETTLPRPPRSCVSSGSNLGRFTYPSRSRHRRCCHRRERPSLGSLCRRGSTLPLTCWLVTRCGLCWSSRSTRAQPSPPPLLRVPVPTRRRRGVWVSS